MIFNSEQSSAITHVEGPMVVIAGPGSGKTTVITQRIKHMIESAGVSPADILVITFTRAAANEMEERFRQLTKGNDYPVRFGTFHSIFFWIIKTAYRLDNSSIISETDKRGLIEQIMHELSIDAEAYGSRDDVINNILSQIGIVKCDLIDIDSYYSQNMPEEEFRDIYKAFDKRMKKLGKIDFDDMMVMCYELLNSRKDILERCRNLFKYIMVDEFQDSNKIQYEIFKILAEPGNNAFIVGDDDQSVYGFRGARPEIMQRFTQDFPGARIVRLGVNYRCDQAITRASSKVIAQNKRRFSKVLTSNSSEEGKVTLYYPKDAAEQNDCIVAKIRENFEHGMAYEDQAVLYRTNIQPRRLAYKLNQYNIPFTISDNLPNIFDNFVVKNCIDYMKFALGDNTRARFLRIMNKPVRYITRDSLIEEKVDLAVLKKKFTSKVYVMQNISKLQTDLELISHMKPFAALNYIRRGIGLDSYLLKYAGEKNLDYEEMADILDEFAYMIKDTASYQDMFRMIEEYQEELKNLPRDKRQTKGVRLMTMHSSKGLEFDTVYIIDAVEGINPYKKAKTAAELEEERRMFYVAMTRARHELNIYAPKTIAGKNKKPSRYISPKVK
jgi:DNA helicase-2/ATP-dependent DNA helicase PcrA